MSPLVSIVTPTYGRASFLSETRRWVLAQTHANFEWLILDDSPEPNPLFAPGGDPRIRYLHVPERLSVGDKRNRLAAAARGQYIAHFDDDDYYAPRYLESMVGALEAQGADFVHLCSWYLYDLRHDFFGFWSLRAVLGLHYLCYADGLRIASFTPQNNSTLQGNHLGYGFTYLYRREVAAAARFAPVNWAEESAFLDTVRQRFKILSMDDQSGLVLHVLHPGSTSSCFPQYHLPSFLVPSLFREPSAHLLALRAQRSATGRTAPAG